MKRVLVVLVVLLLPGCCRPVANFLDRCFPPHMPAPNEPHFGGVGGGPADCPPLTPSAPAAVPGP